ncbi:MAG: diadenylate cyclase [Chlorobi bacterium]|nr:diadenylate cyclase [Chlorobiota bacterium]
MLENLDIRLIDVVDVLLFAFMAYYLYRLIRGTMAMNIFIGVAIIYVIWKITERLHMRIMSEILGSFLGLGVIALLIVFQQEVRQFLLVLGSKKWNPRGILSEFRFFHRQPAHPLDIDAVISALKNLSIKKHGALILIKKNQSLDFLKQKGDRTDILVNEPIIESIFNKTSPLHDGAAIIEGNRIVATRVVIPISPDVKLPKKYGLRHHAAASATMISDALALVVSEENGEISFFKNGKSVKFKDLNDLKRKLARELDLPVRKG